MASLHIIDNEISHTQWGQWNHGFLWVSLISCFTFPHFLHSLESGQVLLILLECLTSCDGLKMSIFFLLSLQESFVFLPLETVLACTYFKQSEVVLGLNQVIFLFFFNFVSLELTSKKLDYLYRETMWKGHMENQNIEATWKKRETQLCQLTPAFKTFIT